MEALKSSSISIQPIKGIHSGLREREEIKRLRELHRRMVRKATTPTCLMRSSLTLSQLALAQTSLQSAPQATTLRSREKTLSISRKTFSRIIAKTPPSSVKPNQRLFHPFATWTHRRRVSHPSRPLPVPLSPSRRWLHSSTWWIPMLQFSSHQPTLSTQTTIKWFLSHSQWPSSTSRPALTSCQSQWPSNSHLLSSLKNSTKSSATLNSSLLTRLAAETSRSTWRRPKTSKCCSALPSSWSTAC